MPAPKALSKQDSLVEEVATFLGIDPSVVFRATNPFEEVAKGKGKWNGKNTLRIWTGNMNGDEKDRIRALKADVKAMASAVNTKIAMSDRHPLGNDGQLAFEERRRAQRGNKWNARNSTKKVPNDWTPS